MDKSVLITQAQTHNQVGNPVAAVAALDTILSSDPSDFQALALKADFSRSMYPEFSGNNGQFISCAVTSRVQPVIGNYSIAMQFCPDDRKDEFKVEAISQLLEYAYSVLASDIQRHQSAAAASLTSKSNIYSQVASKAQQFKLVSTKDFLDVADLIYDWGAMTKSSAAIFAESIRKGKNDPRMAALYTKLQSDFPGLNLPEQKGCFPGSAKVSVPGGYKLISSIKKGDLVLTVSKTGEHHYRPVTRVLKHGAQAIEMIYFDDGTKMRVTGNHRVLTSTGWRKVSSIKPGCRVVQADGIEKCVVEVFGQPKEVVFNLYTAIEHTFVVDGCVVHNFSEFMTIRTAFHRLMVDPFSRGLRVVLAS